jgi:hypothetical protein
MRRGIFFSLSQGSDGPNTPAAAVIVLVDNYAADRRRPDLFPLDLLAAAGACPTTVT